MHGGWFFAKTIAPPKCLCYNEREQRAQTVEFDKATETVAGVEQEKITGKTAIEQESAGKTAEKMAGKWQGKQ